MAETIYKKREGLLVLSKNQQQLSWTPNSPPKAQPELTVLVSNITNLQQTPPDKPKVMLKLFAQSDKSVEPLVYLFNFSSPTQARAQADALRDSLSKAIQAAKSTTNATIISGEGQPSALAIASVVSKPGNDPEILYSDERLKNNIELQQSLLAANPALSKTLMESLRTKPEAISTTQFTKQFWTSRLHLLRAHAVEQAQSKGAYNVLSTIKPRTEDNAVRLNISREQINLIFSQHPLLRRVYDENVPKLSEADFWTRFFQSRLLKKFKGERVTEADSKDNIFDKYLSQEDETRLQKQILESHIPHIINIHGNEENHSQRKGNAPDLLMRPTAVEKVPIIRTLNSLSERIMSQVAPSDIDPSQPIGMDEETFNALALRDLQGDVTENRLILNVKDQSRFFASGKDTSADLDLLTSTKTTPSQLLKRLQTSQSTDKPALSTHDLTASLGLNPDSDTDSETDTTKQSAHFSSRRALKAANLQILELVNEQRTQNEDLSSASNNTSITIATRTHLSVQTLDRLSLTHATTTEFLHYFWTTFLSGDPARADEIASLATTLERAKQRIEAVATDAEAERGVEVEKLKRQAAERARRLGRKVPVIDENIVKGGRKAVERLMEPTVGAIDMALRKYEEAKMAPAREEAGV
jgi:transcription initiation factor TFIIH subunit 1